METFRAFRIDSQDDQVVAGLTQLSLDADTRGDGAMLPQRDIDGDGTHTVIDDYILLANLLHEKSTPGHRP